MDQTLKVSSPFDVAEKVRNFYSFLLDYKLLEKVRHCGKRIYTLCIWHARLNLKKTRHSVPPSDRTVQYMPKPFYIPADSIQVPEVPHFRQMIDNDDLPIMSAPRVCQLCGDGFLNFQQLCRHCDDKHGSWSEYRKRLFYLADYIPAVKEKEVSTKDEEAPAKDIPVFAQPLPKMRKRQQLANFTHHLTYSTPGDGGPPEPRRQEACAVCARKAWLESLFRTYLFKSCKSHCSVVETEENEEEEVDKDNDEEEVGDIVQSEQQKARVKKLLKDVEGKYYFGDPKEVNKLLSVEKYREAFPQIPLEELHASSVQHPDFLEYRWLLHTKRVPMLAREEADKLRLESKVDARELPVTAGVGDPNKCCWLCRDCRNSLCHEKDVRMPGPALANYMWGGREHPLFQDLNYAMRTLLGRGRPYLRKIILRGNGSQGESDAKESGLVGNSILLAQPTTGEIQATLPPPVDSLGDNMVVIFTRNREDVRKAKHLFVSRERFLQCAKIRKNVCYAYQDVTVDEAAAAQDLPEDGVPDVFVQEAYHMSEAQFFEPKLDGPASVRVPETGPSSCVDCVDADKEIEDDEARDGSELVDADKEAEEQNVDSTNETVLGLDEAHTDDPLRQLLCIQRQMQLLKEEGQQLLRRQAKMSSNGEEHPTGCCADSTDSLYVQVEAGKEQCKHYFLSLREMAKQLRDKWQMALEQATQDADRLTHGEDRDLQRTKKLAVLKAKEESIFKMTVIGTDHLDGSIQAAESSKIRDLVAEGSRLLSQKAETLSQKTFHTNDSLSGAGATVETLPVAEGEAKGLNVCAGKPLSIMSSMSWVYSFVEFFYGDCLPMQPDRPQQLSFDQVFRYLLEREELEYHLASDETRYRARPMSRWDSPMFVMLFASTLRSLNLLRAAKLKFLDGDKAKSFRNDLRALATAKAEDFQEILEYNKSKNSNSLLSLMQSPYVRQTNKPVFRALKNLLFETSTVPLTEGNKMKVRQQSFALSLYFGSLKLFITTNFADTYSPVILQLYDLTGIDQAEARTHFAEENLIGEARANLFDDNPEMPTLQSMHQLVTRHPTLQAHLFLLMEKLVITELLCIQGARIGRVNLQSLDNNPSFYEAEDDIASTGEPGLANFATSMIEPLEAQGRGFAHGHKKVTGLPAMQVNKLKQMFSNKEDDLQQFLTNMRNEVLRAAVSIQYDSATLPARQFGLNVAKEPFSEKQQMQSRMDGGLEVDEITVRPHLEIRETELKGHVRRERDSANKEGRGVRSEWSQLPLTGCQQAMMPNYRQRSAFGCMDKYKVDAYGATEDFSSSLEPQTFNRWVKFDDTTGKVGCFLMPDGKVASPEQLSEDAKMWAHSYANDARSLHIQNHTHNCSATCIKYAGEKQQTSLAADKVPACRFLFFHIVEVKMQENGREVTKRFLRRGKELVEHAYIASSNDRNEFGRPLLERTHPFMSSTSDLLQAALRCNADIQFMDRAVPADLEVLNEDEAVLAAAAAVAAVLPAVSTANESDGPPSQTSRILFGVKVSEVEIKGYG